MKVFPSSLRVNSKEEARAKLERASIGHDYRRQLMTIAETLIESDADEGITTDDLMAVTGLSPERVRKALDDLEKWGVASNDTVLTAFVHTGGKKLLTATLSRKRPDWSRRSSLLCKRWPPI